MTQPDTDFGDVPSWVPEPIKSMAAVLQIAPDVRRRLLYDNHMKSVWDYLKRIDPSKCNIDHMESWQRLKGHDIDEYKLSNLDIANAGFFAFALFQLSNEWPVMTEAAISSNVDEWRRVAKLCRGIYAYDMRPTVDPKLAEALDIVAKHFDHCANDLMGRQSPYRIGKSSSTRNDDQVRVKARAISAEARKTYGLALCGIVAKLLTVGMDLKGNRVDRKTVENWTADLPSQ